MERIDGKKIALEVLADCKIQIEKLKIQGITPGLAVVLIGEDPASKVYVGSKVRKCAEKIHGILVQSPPPKHIDEEKIIRAINPAKDVDGFHPENVAKLALEDPTGFVPCTPAGCLKLIQSYGIETQGAEVVIIGRSMMLKLVAVPILL